MMPTLSEKREKGLAIIAEIAGRPVGELRPEHHLVGDLAIDSPKALQLLLALEEKLGLDEISDEAAAKMETVGDVLRYLEQV